MSPLKVVAILLIVGGVLGLAYGSFTYVSDTHDVDLGITEFTVKEHETVNIPVWAGVAGVAAGAVMLFARKSS